MRAIVYTSNTGSTEKYAKMLSHQIVVPAYSIKIEHIAMYVNDLERAKDFFTKHFNARADAG